MKTAIYVTLNANRAFSPTQSLLVRNDLRQPEQNTLFHNSKNLAIQDPFGNIVSNPPSKNAKL
jgi:hypothetical protein